MASACDDPRLKFIMKQAILNILYTPFHERRQRVMDNLVIRNQILVKDPKEVFTFKGNVYGRGHIIPRPKLHPELHEEMQFYLDELVHLEKWELPQVENYITYVLNKSPSYEDWALMMPEVLRTPIKVILNAYTTPPRVLTDDEIETVVTGHQPAISLMKERMAMNLIYV